MGWKVERTLDLMRQILASGDQALADLAIAGDDDIDATNLSLTEQCYDLLRRQQPVAGDLRLVVSVIRVASELERIADLALRIAKLAPEHADLVADPLVSDILTVMAGAAAEAVRVAMAAWAGHDLALAESLSTAPSTTRHLSERLMGHLVDLRMPDAARIAVHAAAAAQALDRIADHARVIGARVRYLLTGDSTHLVAEVR